MSTKIEFDIPLTELAEEAGAAIPGLQYLHAWQTYRGVKICEEYGLLEDPDIGEKLVEHFNRTRLLNLLKHLGPAETAEKALVLPMIVKAQKATTEAIKKAAEGTP